MNSETDLIDEMSSAPLESAAKPVERMAEGWFGQHRHKQPRPHKAAALASALNRKELDYSAISDLIRRREFQFSRNGQWAVCLSF
jgi:hypothetical protein